MVLSEKYELLITTMGQRLTSSKLIQWKGVETMVKLDTSVDPCLYSPMTELMIKIHYDDY